MRLSACVVVLGACALAPAAGAATVRPLVPLHDAAAVVSACEQGLARARRMIGAMESRRGAGVIFAEWNRLDIAIEDVVNPIYLLGNVHPDKALRDATEPCLQKFTALSTEILQNEKLFARVLAARPGNPRQAKLRKDLLEGFEDSGVALPADKRRRAKEIFDRLEELRQTYDRNVREDPTRLVFTPEEVHGLPQAYLKARTRDEQGNYVLGLDYPSYFPFLANATSETAPSCPKAARRTWRCWRRSSGCAGNSRSSTGCQASPTTQCAARWCALPKR